MDNNNSKGFSILTTDMLNDQKRIPYTKREILQQEYPSFWGRANELVRLLRELQNLLVELMPVYRSGLPRLSAQLENIKIQSFFLSYIKCRILYAFTETIWKKTEQLCANLLKPDYNASAQSALNHTFAIFHEYFLFDVVRDEENGYTLMKEMIKKYECNLDFNVFLPGWRYTDIVKMIEYKGLQDEQFLKDVLDNQDPREANIGELLDDDKMDRIY